nr:hypothetical protein [uncultured Sphingomonas sp.]
MEARAELITLIERLLAVPATEEEEQAVTDRISLLSPDPAWSDYLFYSDAFLQPDGHPDAARVVEKILSAKPIVL